MPTEKNPVLFLVDEAAHIGKMQALEDAVTLMRGMGIRLWLFFQSIEQLKKCFGDNAGTVLDNLATQQYFSINLITKPPKRCPSGSAKQPSSSAPRATIRASRPIGGDSKNPPTRTSGTEL